MTRQETEYTERTVTCKKNTKLDYTRTDMNCNTELSTLYHT